MKFTWKPVSALLFVGALLLFFAWPATEAATPLEAADPQPQKAEFFVSDPVEAGTSLAVRDLPTQPNTPYLEREINPRHNPLLFEADMGRRGTWERTERVIDPLIANSQNGGETPALDLSFDGSTGCNGCSPPDVVGDVGPNHYVSMVNVHFSIFDKSGNLLTGPTAFNALFAGQGGVCESANDGDPIPMYDEMADRWLLSQFASPTQMCIAISQTPDPTGAYYLYEYDVGTFPDYFKFGVWPDGYYMSANEGSYTAYAFDRNNMLNGTASTFQKFTGGTNLYLPSDLDGPTAPPADAPNYFYTFKDDDYHSVATDRIEIYEFDVDWATPTNTTFALAQSIDVTAFTYTACGFFNFNCIMQQDTSQRFDGLGEWPMFRFPYRNFDTHQTLLGTFSVGGGTGEVGSAIRWFELRNTGSSWTLYQEGTQDPGDGHDRMNASIAMDKDGNIALGYTVSSSNMFPSIRYATRLASDPLGTLQAEAVLIDGMGSQTDSNRWGDYSAMSIDPSDDCTFWYTNEYYQTTSESNWSTRVGAFHYDECTDSAYGVTLPANMSDSGASDSTVTYSVSVQNTGQTDDTYDLAISGETWTTTLSDATVSVASGASATVTVSVQIPGSAANGDNDTATLTATSQGDTSVSATTNLTTTSTGAPTSVTMSEIASSPNQGSVLPWLLLGLVIPGLIWVASRRRQA